MNYIDKTLSLTKSAESPEAYFKWAAIASLCATCRDNIYVPTRYGPVYANMYILLIGPPATRKGRPCSLAYKLSARTKNTKLILGRTSIQALLPYLNEAQTLDSGKILKDASIFIVSKELRALFVDDPQVIGLLTDLYDFHEEWMNNLVRLGGIASLKRNCITLLAASNEKLLREVFDATAIEGGLLSRTILIMEETKKCHSSGVDEHLGNAKEDELLVDTSMLEAHLKKLARKKGPLFWEPDAAKEYDKWYLSFSKGIEQKNQKSRTGIDGRIHENVLKLIAALSVADFQLPMRITQPIVEESIDTILPLMKNYDKFAMGSGSSSDHTPAMLLLASAYDAPNHTIEHKSFLRTHLGDINIKQLDEEIVPKLEQAELVKIVSVGSKGIAYKLTSKAIEMFEGQK